MGDGPTADRICELRERAGHQLKRIREQLDSHLVKLHLRHNEQGCQLYRAMVKTNVSKQFPLYLSWILYFVVDDLQVGSVATYNLNEHYDEFLRSILTYTSDKMKSKLKAEIQHWVRSPTDLKNVLGQWAY